MNKQTWATAVIHCTLPSLDEGQLFSCRCWFNLTHLGQNFLPRTKLPASNKLENHFVATKDMYTVPPY